MSRFNEIAKKTGDDFGEANEIFQCKICERSFQSRNSLCHHSYEHSDIKSFTCNVVNCYKAFKSPKRLSEHKRRTHFSCNFLCEICGYSTRLAHNLRTHVQTHTTSNKQYCCEKCSSLFTTLTDLKEHLRTHRGIPAVTSSRAYSCIKCAVVFSSSKAFYHHRKLHLPCKSYICYMCGAAYSQAAGMSQHYRWHKMQDNKGFPAKITIETVE